MRPDCGLLSVPAAIVALAGTERTNMTNQKAASKLSKLDGLEALVCTKNGATIAEMVAATGWQQHSVRGAIAGALKKRGLVITSEKIDNERRYRASRPA